MFSAKEKDAAFFDSFTAHAAKSIEAARLLLQMLARTGAQAGRPGGSHPDEARDGSEIDAETLRLAARIKELEATGDAITHETIKRLRENWITPLDRDDIHALISRLDDVLDAIEAAAARIELFRVGVAVPAASELAELVVCCCESLLKAVGLLRSMAKAHEILALCVEVNRLENAADQVYRAALAELFRPGNDPILIMKWRDIIDYLESAANRCEDVANIIEGVVLEYS